MGIIARKKRILLNEPHLETASGGVANFKTDLKAPLKECKISFLPKQSGSGDPSPTNIRPITGWDGVSITRCGKNLFSGTERDTLYPVHIPVGTKVSASVKGKNSGVRYYDKDRVRIDYWTLSYTPNFDSSRRYNTFTIINRDCEYFEFYGDTSPTDMQVEIIPQTSSQPTPYESYTATTFPVTWQSSGTVYGGYVDLVSGELIAEWAAIKVNGSQTLYGGVNASYNGSVCTNRYVMLRYNCVVISYTSSVVQDHVKCDKLSPISKPIWSTPDDYPWHCVINSRTQFHFTLDNATLGIQASDNYQTRNAAIVTWLAQNPITLIYELATPQLIATITPQQLKTLKGINNIYSDADSAEVKFWTH